MQQMDLTADIVLFSNNAGVSRIFSAQRDATLSSSIVSAYVLRQIGLVCDEGEHDSFESSSGIVYHPIGKIELKWGYKTGAEDNLETFYVVDSQDEIVLLGASAFMQDELSNGERMYAFGVQKPNPGMAIRSFPLQ